MTTRLSDRLGLTARLTDLGRHLVRQRLPAENALHPLAVEWR